MVRNWSRVVRGRPCLMKWPIIHWGVHLETIKGFWNAPWFVKLVLALPNYTSKWFMGPHGFSAWFWTSIVWYSSKRLKGASMYTRNGYLFVHSKLHEFLMLLNAWEMCPMQIHHDDGPLTCWLRSEAYRFIHWYFFRHFTVLSTIYIVVGGKHIPEFWYYCIYMSFFIILWSILCCTKIIQKPRMHQAIYDIIWISKSYPW